jgi:ADP-ribose pyrophosphatase YjhB (NUDIX family)
MNYSKHSLARPAAQQRRDKMPEYLKNLRRQVGTAPILICGASVIVENEKGEILLQLRSDNKCRGYAGGIVDINEVVEETAKRELFEETGITANSLELFGVFSGEEHFFTYPNGHEVSNVDIIFICKDFAGEPKADLVESDAVNIYELVGDEYWHIGS